MNRRILPYLATGIAAVSTGFLVSPAQAQSAESASAPERGDSATQLGDIVVTAQRREQNLLDVPVAVSAIQAETLERRQIVDVSSLERIAPSLSVAPFGDSTTPMISIRGQIAQDIVASIDPAVGIYVDGVYLGRATGGNLSFLDVERVEVLRGPQGTLFGRNTIGGAISITPKHPTDVLEGEFSANYGNFNTFGASGILNVPLGDTVAVRVAASHQQRDGFARSSLTGAELNAENQEYLRASLKADLGSDWDVLVSGDLSDSENDGQWLTLVKTYPLADLVAKAATGQTIAVSQYIGPFSRHPASTTRGPFTSRNWGTSGIISGRLGDVNVKSITSYRQVKRRLFNFDQDASPFDLLQILSNKSDQHQISQELQVYGKAMDNRLDWIVGAYYFSERGRDTVITHNVYPLSPNYSIIDAIAKNQNLAAYGQLSYAFSDRFSAFAGIRYAHDRRDIILMGRTAGATPAAVISCTIASAPLPGCAFKPPRRSFEYAPFSVGLNYKPGRNALLYLKWSRGFRSGGFNTRGTTVATLLPFGPEHVDSYELGGKVEVARRFRLNAAAFQSNFKDVQVLTSVPTTAGPIDTLNQNAGTARIRGLELEGEAAFGNLRLNGALSILDAKYRKLAPGVVGLLVNSPFLLTPKASWSVSADYDIPTNFGSVVLHGDFNWRSRVFFQAAPPADPINQQKGYGLVNASIDTRIGDHISLQLFGKNLTDKKYFNRTNAFQALGAVSAYPGDPRTYGVSASYKF